MSVDVCLQNERPAHLVTHLAALQIPKVMTAAAEADGVSGDSWWLLVEAH